MAVPRPHISSARRPMKSSFNASLASAIFFLSTVIIGRLAVTAEDTDNWHGFLISTMHTLTVAVGSYYALRQQRPARNAPGEEST